MLLMTGMISGCFWEDSQLLNVIILFSDWLSTIPVDIDLVKKYVIIRKEVVVTMEFSKCLPFWDELTQEQQQRISRVIQYRKTKKGTHIHDSSAECLGLVMVRCGQLRAYILTEDGREIKQAACLNVMSAFSVLPVLCRICS